MSKQKLNSEKLDIQSSVTPAVTPPSATPDRKQIGRDKLQKYMKEELRLVKGIFLFPENPGGSEKVTVRKYPGHMFEKTMKDGEEYEIPLYVARFLNGVDVTAEAIDGKLGTCGYNIKQYPTSAVGINPSALLDANGNPMLVNKHKRRFGFQSLEFAGSLQ